MGKRLKMNFWDFDKIGQCYHDFQRVSDNKGNEGYRYTLGKKLTQEQIDIIKSYKNTIISSCQHKYAPEIKYDTVIILDKCIKGVN